MYKTNKKSICIDDKISMFHHSFKRSTPIKMQSKPQTGRNGRSICLANVIRPFH